MSTILNLMLAGVVISEKAEYDEMIAKMENHRNIGNLTNSEYQYLVNELKGTYEHKTKRRQIKS
jgi:hypothetical protein